MGIAVISRAVRSKSGTRKDLGFYVRSKMEANIARYYKFIKVNFQYEPKEFEFKGIKRGNRFYKPDFYLPKYDRWIEVKGWFNDCDKTKIRRFKKYYPKEFVKLYFIIYTKYGKGKGVERNINFLCGELKVEWNKIIGYTQISKGWIPYWE